MTKATNTLTVFSILSVLYLIFYLGFVPLSEKVQNEIIPVIPWWALVCFGCHCLGNIGYALFTFRDCPEAYHELMTEISQAKADLRAKGMQIN
ncbi:dolichol-phosphate mannosyltransferase subunit 3 [Cokeromyces recurvatus]|uniref:dolichol-phosphate mannosyltransferase subunit 3 n=1 Tax=Cokeromyces recurvatus TaxID=90255 RepID=UPI00221E51AE|nr:dolichol-phosphate mannosyltransferase subunit 3 [Cokeromyces recurvatus]KAI7899363.1 dolichol-phosphate mannosyltransferase subunit 3 [Cokeromyces recurvatus]